MPIIAIAMGGILFSCVDSGKDLYDPSYETSNPMGDGFAAPDGFDWSTIKTENVTVEVKDEEGGLYSYLVEYIQKILLLMKTHLYWLQGQQIKRITLKLQLLSLCYLRKKVFI